MPSPRPTLAELDQRLRTKLASRIAGTDPLLRKSYIEVLGRAVAAVAHGLYGRIEYAEKQIFPGSSDEDTLLNFHAPLRGISQTGGEYAAGPIDAVGLDDEEIEAGTLLTRSDGVTFSVDETAVIVGGAASVSISAVEAGSNGNTPAGATLSFVSPLENVDSTATVAAGGIVGGADVEVVERVRERVKERWRRPPQGGALHDYVAWAREVAGVTRVWPVREVGGEVVVRYVLDDELDIFPDAAHVALVQAHLEVVRPMTAEVIAVSPVPVPRDFEIQLSPNTPAVQAAVTAEINDLITRDGKPGGTLLLSKIREAVSVAAGEGNNVVVSPIGDLLHLPGQMPVPGEFSFSEVS